MAAIFDMLLSLGCTVEPCGSRVTCSPAPENTDADYLIQIVQNDKDTVGRIVNELFAAGFSWEGNEHYQDAAGEFMSWRSEDNINLIVTKSVEFAARHRAATALCKRLNLLSKSDRIALFQAVLYGNEWNGETWSEMKTKRMNLSIEPAEVPF